MQTIRQNQLACLAFRLNASTNATLVLTSKLHQLPERQSIFCADVKQLKNL